MAEMILVEENHGIVWVTLNRPEVRNALSRDVNLQLHDIARGFEQRDDVRIVVLTGAGEKAFCAGADLKERKGVTAAETAPYLNAIAGAIEAWGNIKQPTLCLMNGSAYGGGLELAMACDFRVLVEGAEVGLTEVRLGIMPGAGGTVRMPRLIGEARAKELIMLGRRIGAARALEIGLVSQVVARDKLRAAADEIIKELSGCAPISVAVAKSSIERGYGKSIGEALEIERECYERTLFSEDRDEGLAAFAEGRPPNYQGR
ncbi:MAG TPA: enoyl-CoA hydratase-related protein [Kofleriaceae bacterium]